MGEDAHGRAGQRARGDGQEEVSEGQARRHGAARRGEDGRVGTDPEGGGRHRAPDQLQPAVDRRLGRRCAPQAPQAGHLRQEVANERAVLREPAQGAGPQAEHRRGRRRGPHLSAAH